MQEMDGWYISVYAFPIPGPEPWLVWATWSQPETQRFGWIGNWSVTASSLSSAKGTAIRLARRQLKAGNVWPCGVPSSLT